MRDHRAEKDSAGQSPKGPDRGETAQLLGCLVLTPLAGRHRTGRACREAAPPFGLYVDEVQDFASAPVPWDEMFAQGRKYGLALTVAHQNLSSFPRSCAKSSWQTPAQRRSLPSVPVTPKVMERLFAPALTAADLQALDATPLPPRSPSTTAARPAGDTDHPAATARSAARSGPGRLPRSTTPAPRGVEASLRRQALALPRPRPSAAGRGARNEPASRSAGRVELASAAFPVAIG